MSNQKNWVTWRQAAVVAFYAALAATGLVALDPSQAVGTWFLAHPRMALLLGAMAGLPICLLRMVYLCRRLPPGAHLFFGVPPSEAETWMLTILKAEMLARDGQASEGLERLRAALGRAEGLRGMGEPWAEKLIRYYQRELARYVSRHGTN